MIEPGNQKYVIGIDIGTGSAKAVAVNEEGIIIADSQYFYSTQTDLPGYSEQDPAIIWKAFTDCIKEISKMLSYPPASICFSSAMHSLVVVNSGNQPVTPLITWADTRSEKIAEQIRKSPAAENIYRTTGTPIHSMSPLCKIIWLKENEPLIFKEAFKFISIKEYIWHQLFHEYEVDQSVASATGLFDIHTLQWNLISLQLCNIETAQLSQIVPTNFTRKALAPAMASLLAIPVNTLFCIGASDGCLANIGSYAVEKGTAALTIGTSGAVRIANAQPIFNFGAMTFNYVLDAETFICGGPVNNGGNVVTWLFESFLHNSNPSETDYAGFFKSIDTVPAGSKGLIFLPYLTGERAPIWDEQSSGVFFGIKSYHTNACFLRAALEGICYSLRNVLEVVESSTEGISQLNVSGGFIHSETWVQILADVCGKNTCIIETGDASALGAALLNMKTIKIIKEYSSLKPVKNVIIEPNMKNHEMHRKNYSIFKNLYEPLKESMHQIFAAYK